MSYVLVPTKQNTPLKNIPLVEGLNVIGRAPLDGVTIAMAHYGVPQSLVKFISRKHLQIDIKDGNNIILTPVTSLQVILKISFFPFSPSLLFLASLWLVAG
jgi:hypothetical protein